MKKVHDRTHPTAKLDKPKKPEAADIEEPEPTEEALLEALEAERDDEDDG